MSQQYYQIIEVTDAGPYVTRLLLCMPRPVRAEELEPERFSVYVELKDRDGSRLEIPKSFLERDQMVQSCVYRPVQRAFPSTMTGEEVPESRIVALEMPFGPAWDCSCALIADHGNINGHSRYIVHHYRVICTGPIGSGEDALWGAVFDRCAGVLNPMIQAFQQDVSSDPQHPIRYGYFVPRTLEAPRALIIYLHGAGEGGQDLPVAYSGHKVPELTGERVQKLFGGAFVLVPQCDTMWMDDGSGEYGDSGVSMYTEALRGLIGEFMDRFRCAIDPDRVYIGGDSNGGFMTMRMLMSYPDLFAGAFPICEAMPDERITDEQIERLRTVPIWFTHAKNDPTVNPETTVVATHRRLMAAGAGNCHFTFWDNIVDRHGQIRDAEGEPYEYIGHFAWVPVLNDDCRLDRNGQPVLLNGQPVTLLEWLAGQKRQHS